MEFYGSNNEHYLTGRELGRGGEGAVYELQNDGSRVLKHYTEPLSVRQIQKLHKMASMLTPQVEAFAAWPQALVRDKDGVICGFVMKKLKGFVPLHMIFSPLDRKRLFPDKGYNFLVHVARNLATAFHKLHEAGLVVGDVNEGNILINASGMVSFIDCDSFQVKGDDSYYYCEVGVPRYTPPELLELQTFEKVVRSANTDNFSMAVLIFQLLFLGRHPFAGRNTTKQDIDEETAIKMREFAYSQTARAHKLSPPKDSLSISAMSQSVVDNFHRAFETADRPTAGDWVSALDSYLVQMVTCEESRLHVYPSGLASCPWCAFRKERGIMYFLDDNYLQANSLLNDIENFVNGFKPEKLELKQWSGDIEDKTLKPAPLEAQWVKDITIGVTVLAVLVVAGLLLAITVNVAAVIVATFLIVLWRKYGGINIRIREKRGTQKALYDALVADLRKAVFQYNNPGERAQYNELTEKLNDAIERFRNLPEQQNELKQAMEERLYNEQLHSYLRQFDILNHNIPSFGQARKTLLLNAGIRNASDVSLLQTTRVSGIGPKNIQVLLEWQRQMSGGFVYIPDQDKLNLGMLQVTADMQQLKSSLENEIRSRYQSVSYLKLNITNKALVLENQIKDLVTRSTQARLDMQAFKRATFMF